MNTLKRLLSKLRAHKKTQQAVHIAKITTTGIYTIVHDVANPPANKYHSNNSLDWKE